MTTRTLVIGGETVLIEKIQTTDYAISRTRSKDIKEIKTAHPKKYLIRVPSYDVEYVSNTFSQLKENLRMLADSLKEEKRSGRQATIFDYLF